jgi:hypothetical protein
MRALLDWLHFLPNKGSWPHLVNPLACYSKNGYLRRDSLLLERRFSTMHALSSERKQADSPNVAMNHDMRLGTKEAQQHKSRLDLA